MIYVHATGGVSVSEKWVDGLLIGHHCKTSGRQMSVATAYFVAVSSLAIVFVISKILF
jgi:hypothetical protein